MQEAKTISYHLIEEKQAACVNIVPSITSIYQWNDTVEESSEYLLIIKTTSITSCQTRLIELHSYECPEAIALPIDQGFPPYLEWLTTSCR